MIIDGKKVAETIQSEIQREVSALKGRPPCLAVVLVGENLASQIYVNRKTKACQEAGIQSVKKEFPSSMTLPQLLQVIEQLNKDSSIDGILVQLPLPEQIDPLAVIKSIDPDKDIDGFHPMNMGKLIIGDKTGFTPCTPLGIQVLLQHYKLETSGKHAVIMGRSNIVGKPMAALLMQPGPGGNATVTVTHSKTTNIKGVCASADILIVAMGKTAFVTPEMVKEGAVVIDVGMNRMADSTKSNGYRLVGDVDYEAVSPKCSAITPVPGGVGPMTIAMLLNNTLLSYKRRCTQSVSSSS